MSAGRLSAAEVAAASGLAHPPTDEQAAVIEAPLQPLLVVAGAGSGKTETMAARVVWLVVNGLVQPDQVLGLTFTRKAAAELAERVSLRLRRVQHAGLWVPGRDDQGAEALGGTPTISTYHSYAGRLVRENALRLGREPDSRLLSEAAAWQYAAEAVAGFDGDLTEMHFAESTAISAVVDLAGELAEHLLSTDDLRRELDQVIGALNATPLPTKPASMPSGLVEMRTALVARRALLPVVDTFDELKRSRDALDFADQVALAARLARDFPEIGRDERARFRVVLLDEFQDTSEAQLVLLRSLFVAAGQPVPVTAVGDPHQSIYGWRGASATTLTRFPDEFSDGSRTPVLQLSTTWRNDAAILAAANIVSAPLREKARVDVAPLRARAGAGPGDVEAARLTTHLEEAAYVAQWLVRVRSRATTTAAVLCRKRSQFGPIMSALEDAGLPFEVVGLGGLLLTPEVVDLVAALRVIADPSRGDALMRLLLGPSCRLGAADLDALHEWARFRQRVILAQQRGELGLDLDPAGRNEDTGLDDPHGPLVDLAPDVVDEPSLVEALDDLPPPQWRGGDGQRFGEGVLARLSGLAEAIRRLRRLTGLPLAELVGEAERALGLDVEVLARPDYTPEAARAHLDAFADVAAEFSTAADRPSLAGFLAWLDAAIAEERGLEKATAEPSRDAVQILTVHAAKGLEWDVVAVPGLTELNFPASMSNPNPRYDGKRWTMPDPAPSGWTIGAAGVPYALRGDADGLPVLRCSGAKDLGELEARRKTFRTAEGQRGLEEERRLAYVAVTRARQRLLLTTSVWSSQKKHRVTSRFMRELVRARDELGLRVTEWAPMPDPLAVPANPVDEECVVVLWPPDPDHTRVEAVRRAATVVSAARETLGIGPERHAATDSSGSPRTVTAGAAAAAAVQADPYAADVEMLLTERRSAGSRTATIVEVPTHISASDVVQFAADPVRFANGLRRPMPSEPALAARRGTAFHAWVEQHFARAALLDPSELPGSADQDPGNDAELPALKATFLASEWAAEVPLDVEVAIETVVDGIAVRGRIDAVFARADGGVTVVDWKTGDPPIGAAAAHRALQLGAYALAYGRLRGLAPEQVDAAFYYARTGRTVRPELPGESELRTLLASIPAAAG
ncbi:MAG: ATP-dependent DNA helicase [Candidatus Phosphoribacter sp.]